MKSVNNREPTFAKQNVNFFIYFFFFYLICTTSCKLIISLPISKINDCCFGKIILWKERNSPEKKIPCKCIGKIVPWQVLPSSSAEFVQYRVQRPNRPVSRGKHMGGLFKRIGKRVHRKVMVELLQVPPVPFPPVRTDITGDQRVLTFEW